MSDQSTNIKQGSAEDQTKKPNKINIFAEKKEKVKIHY